MTDGKPSDLAAYRAVTPKVKSRNFACIVACAAGSEANDSYLKELTDKVVHLDTADSATLVSFFQWVSNPHHRHRQQKRRYGGGDRPT